MFAEMRKDQMMYKTIVLGIQKEKELADCAYELECLFSDFRIKFAPEKSFDYRLFQKQNLQISL